MAKNSTFLNFGIFSLIALFVFFIAFRASQTPKILPSKNSTTPIIPPDTIENNPTLNDSIVDFGMKLLGTPYVTAGCSVDGFDCSGFVYYVFQHFDMDVPRSSASFENFGKEIPIEKVQKGDLLLFLSPTRNVIGHIGIVSNPNGRASDFIHASSGREMKVIITNLTNKGYTARFVKDVRVMGD